MDVEQLKKILAIYFDKDFLRLESKDGREGKECRSGKERRSHPSAESIERRCGQ